MWWKWNVQLDNWTLNFLFKEMKRAKNLEAPPELTSRPKRSRFCHIFLVQSLVWKYCLKLEGCLHNFFLIGPYSAAAEPNSAPKIVTQFLEPSLVLLRRFCLNVRTLRMPLNPRNHRCRYTLHSWSLVCGLYCETIDILGYRNRVYMLWNSCSH